MSNTSIYDKLLEFQKLPDAFTDWQEYRSALADYLLAKTPSGSSLAIFGAGRCNDMDLSRFIRHFSSITLIDADYSAMQEALRRYRLADHPQIQIELADFTGISPSDYRSFGDELSSLLNVYGAGTDIHVLADYALFKLDKFYAAAASHTPVFGVNAFDYSVCFGVHSQINNMAAWIWSAFASNLGTNDPAVEQRIIRANDELIPRLNTAILAATKNLAFFGNELSGTAALGTIQGACQCITDLKSRNCLLGQALIPWPFDPAHRLTYQMLIQEADCSHFPSRA